MRKPILIPRRPLLAGLLGLASSPLLASTAPAQGGRAWLGVELAPIKDDKGAVLPGALCRRVMRKSPADAAGLRDGDHILSVDGAAVAVPGDVVRRVATAGLGAKLVLQVEKSQAKSEKTALLSAYPGDLQVAKQHHVGAFAPAWQGITNVRGQVGEVKSRKGRVIVLAFWASWCGACREMIPTLSALEKKFAAEGLSVVGLTDESESIALRAADKHDMRYTLGATTSPETLADYLVRALPTLYVIDKDSKIREIFFGMVDEKTLVQTLKPLLAAK